MRRSIYSRLFGKGMGTGKHEMGWGLVQTQIWMGWGRDPVGIGLGWGQTQSQIFITNSKLSKLFTVIVIKNELRPEF